MKKIYYAFFVLGALLSVKTHAQIYNTISGTLAFWNNTTGDANTVTGYQSLYSNVGAYNNSAHGSWVLVANTGANNSGYGASSMYLNTNGYDNAALGFRALFLNTQGIRNTAAGSEALYYTDNAAFSTGIGFRALYGNTSGNYNVGVGDNTGTNSSTGSKNTFIGSHADAVSAGYYTNSTALGSYALITGDDMVRVGDANVTTIGGTVNWTSLSDMRVKKNIQRNVPGLTFIKLLKPVTYNMDISSYYSILQPTNMKDAPALTEEQLQSRKAKEAKTYTGLLAQDVETAAKSIGYEFSGVDIPKNKNDVYGIRYAEFVAPLITAAQELSATQDNLKTEIADMRDKMNAALQEIETLRTNASGGNPSNLFTAPTDLQAYLEQNTPNPYNSATSIRYHMPSLTSRGQVVVTNLSGQLLKTYVVNGKIGRVGVGRGELATGTYVYTLIMNGKRIDSKKMIVTK
jgi:hypothetical protein